MARHKSKSSYKYSKNKQSRANARVLAYIILAIVVIWLILFAVEAAKPYIILIRNIAITLVILLILWFAGRWGYRYYKNHKLSSEIESYLQKALKAMDQTSNYYTDEKEANKELATTLRALGLPVEYEYKLNERRIADVKVGDILLEGKLSPKTDEVDRLLGQLQDYCTYRYKVNIVIYGYLEDYSLRRIEKEINERYPDKAFLTYLRHPHRRRSDKAKPDMVIKKYYKR